MTRSKILVSAALAMSITAPMASASSLTVTLEDIKKTKGEVRIALFDAEGYEGGEPVAGMVVPIIAETATVTFEDLTPGEYGIKMFHDVDSNGDMNTNPFGMPTEPYAFSNNAKGRFGPAKWDDAKFEIGAEDAAQTISIN